MLLLVLVSILAASKLVTATPPSNVLVSAGEFVHIYNASVGEPTDWYINDHTLVFAGGEWHMFGITHTEPADPIYEVNLAHAINAKSLTMVEGFEKFPFGLGSIAPETHLWAPHIVSYEGVYHMFYCGGGSSDETYMINLAISNDLWSWTRVGNLFEGGWDARDPMVMNLGPEFDNQWALYYCATSPNEGYGNVSHVTYVRTSSDLLDWSDSTPTIVFDAGPTGSPYGGPTESPFVVRRGQNFYLFSGTWGSNYSDTHIFVSQNPFDFGSVPVGNATQVGDIGSHAPEVVRDIDGNWYVTRCGWGQGGLYIAPLTWFDGMDDDNTSMPIPPFNDPPPVNFETNFSFGDAVFSTDGTYGQWVPTSSGLYGGDALGNAFILFDDSTKPSDSFTLKVDITLTTANGNPTGDSDEWTRIGSAAGVVFRAQSSNNPMDGCYVLNIFTNDSDSSIGGVKLFKFQEGQYYVINTYQPKSPIAQGERYDLVLEANEAKFDVYFGANGKDELIFTSTDVTFTSGYFGLNVWQSAAQFQNFFASSD